MEGWWNESGDQESKGSHGYYDDEKEEWQFETKEVNIHNQSTVNFQINPKINNSTQIILGLISPLIITFSLLILFPPCLFWCSNVQGGLTLPSLLFCHSLFIIFGFACSAPRYSIAFMISIIPSVALAFYLWVSM